MLSPVSSADSKQQLETPAIILDCREHGESDLIVTFFCQGFGRMAGIAKGAKRSKKRFVNKLELFTSLRIQHNIPQNGRLAFIAEAELLESFLTIRQNFSCYTTATIIREFVLLATLEMEGDKELYPLLIWALNSLNNTQQMSATLIFFLIRFFSSIGYSPQLDHCQQCKETIQGTKNYCFSTSAGAVTCSSCQKNTPAHSIPLSPGTLKTLVTAQTQTLSRLHRLQLSAHSEKEALAFLHLYGRQLFQREIISWGSLKNPLRI